MIRATLLAALTCGCLVAPVHRGAPAPAPTSPQPDAPPPPPMARVTVLGALIGPGKADGKGWDPGGAIRAETYRELGQILAGANPYTAAAALLAGMAGDKPEPFGRAELVAGGETRGLELPMVYRDTFTPAWEGVAFEHVPLVDGTRLRITLADQDVADHDPMGAVELGPRDFEAAIAAGHVYQVQVADQSNNQILFVAISATRE